MKTPAPADLQRWSEEVARDRASLAFLPLARAYRRLGRRDAALRLCLKGLASHPHHVAAHGLLALLYAEQGDHARAADEWAFVLRLEPDNFDALRGLGFCMLERGELERAHAHLRRAERLRPDDPAVRDALELLASRGFARHADEPAASPARHGQAEAGAGTHPGSVAGVAGTGEGSGGAAAVRSPAFAAGRAAADPAALFDDLLGSGPLLGVLLIDERGLILAGRLRAQSGAELLGAMLSGAIAEAARTVEHLELGTWRGLLLDTADARVHVAPLEAGCALLLAARQDVPLGWVVRTAARALATATRFLRDTQ